MKRTAALFALAAGLGTGAAWFNAATTEAQPPPLAGQCGGQQWHAIAPIDCEKSRVIDGTEVHIHLTQTTSGFTVITYTLGSPRSTDTLIHATSHRGNSDAGGPATDPAGIISAGSTIPVSLTIPQAECGQIDIRAIFDNKAGRVAGPYIINSSCATPPTSSPSTTIPGTTVPTTSPSSGPTTTPGTTVASTVPGTNTVPPGSELAKTGGDIAGPLYVALGAVVFGLGLLVARRRPA